MFRGVGTVAVGDASYKTSETPPTRVDTPAECGKLVDSLLPDRADTIRVERRIPNAYR